LDSGAFDEEQFLQQRSPCCSRLKSWGCLERFYGRRPQLCTESLQLVLRQLGALSMPSGEGEGTQQETPSAAVLTVLCAVYVDRLLRRNPALCFTARNWRILVVAAMRVASKAHEDIHAWNADFSLYLQSIMGVPLSARSLHSLELRFLAGLGFRLEVHNDLYTAYAVALGLLDDPGSTSASVGIATATASLSCLDDELARRDAPPLYRWQPSLPCLHSSCSTARMEEDCGRQVSGSSCGATPMSSSRSRGSSSTSCGSLVSTLSPTSMASWRSLEEASAQ